MLSCLQIRNFALIDNATLEFGEGLNVISGETGSGKSILVQALEILLGGRGTSDLIRQGEEEAEISGLFVSPKMGGETGLRRVISRSGKNRSYLNERPVPVSVIEETAQGLVDLASQHEHQVLLRADRHLGLLDEYAGCEASLEAYRTIFHRHRSLQAEREGLAAKVHEAREKEEFLRYQLKEIDDSGIQEGEEESLQKERDVLKHAVRLGETTLKGEEVLESGEEAIAERLSRLSRELHQAAAIDPQLAPIAARVEESLCQIQEAAKFLRTYGQKIACDPERLQEVEDRLALMSRLKKKHGGSLEALFQKAAEMREGLNLLENFDGELARIDGEIERCEKELARSGKEISARRLKAAQKLSRDVEAELKDLGMTGARFTFDLKPLSKMGESGIDTGEFLIAPNPGEGPRPLVRVASGGEISRIFLAIKKVLGGLKSAETCVFDEVDVGIGGRVAEVVGRNLAEMSGKKQVICITHLPQVACYADHHFVIHKKTERGRTLTRVDLLEKTQREEEIARMLAGIKITEQAMAHAREMLKNAVARH